MADAVSPTTTEDEDIERFRARRRRGSLVALGAILGVGVVAVVLYFALAPGPCEQFATRFCEMAEGSPEQCAEFTRIMNVVAPPEEACDGLLYGTEPNRIHPDKLPAYYAISLIQLVREAIADRERRGEAVPPALRQLLAQYERAWLSD